MRYLTSTSLFQISVAALANLERIAEQVTTISSRLAQATVTVRSFARSNRLVVLPARPRSAPMRNTAPVNSNRNLKAIQVICMAPNATHHHCLVQEVPPLPKQGFSKEFNRSVHN